MQPSPLLIFLLIRSPQAAAQGKQQPRKAPTSAEKIRLATAAHQKALGTSQPHRTPPPRRRSEDPLQQPGFVHDHTDNSIRVKSVRRINPAFVDSAHRPVSYLVPAFANIHGAAGADPTTAADAADADEYMNMIAGQVQDEPGNVDYADIHHTHQNTTTTTTPATATAAVAHKINSPPVMIAPKAADLAIFDEIAEEKGSDGAGGADTDAGMDYEGDGDGNDGESRRGSEYESVAPSFFEQQQNQKRQQRKKKQAHNSPQQPPVAPQNAGKINAGDSGFLSSGDQDGGDDVYLAMAHSQRSMDVNTVEANTDTSGNDPKPTDPSGTDPQAPQAEVDDADEDEDTYQRMHHGAVGAGSPTYQNVGTKTLRQRPGSKEPAPEDTKTINTCGFAVPVVHTHEGYVNVDDSGEEDEDA